MAATGMNFGPDWLREKVDPSKSGNVTGGGGPAASANSIFGKACWQGVLKFAS